MFPKRVPGKGIPERVSGKGSWRRDLVNQRSPEMVPERVPGKGSRKMVPRTRDFRKGFPEMPIISRKGNQIHK